ncbi:MAG: hypothetical protein ACJ76Y_05380 [Thermoanaerobaculia bacterium]
MLEIAATPALALPYVQSPGTFARLLGEQPLFPIGSARDAHSIQEQEDDYNRDGLEPLDLHSSSYELEV